MNQVQQNPTSIRVFLIEEHRIFLWGLQQLVKTHEPVVQLAGSAATIEAALDVVEATCPDVIVLNLNQGAQTIPTLLAKSDARMIVLTSCDDKSKQDRAILDGARGVLNKDASPEIFLEAIRKVHQGQLWLDRAATGRVFVELSRRETKAADSARSGISSLTDREKKIIDCILDDTGASAKTIAKKLHISESTLRNHLTSIYGKFGVSNRYELISRSVKNGQLLRA